MNTIIKSILSTVAICTVTALSAQDTRYSQYNFAPMILNPALAGLNACDYRVALNARTQWNGISNSGNAYTSITASGDISVGKATKFHSFAGMGISLNGDVADGLHYVKTRGDITAAYHFMVDRKGQHSLSFGLQIGVNQRGLNGDGTYEKQYNLVTGAYEPAIANGESITRRNLIFVDAGLGVIYSGRFHAGQHNVYGGVSFQHINQPNVSFYSSGIYNDSGKDRLFAKTTIHGGGSFLIKKKMWIMPQFMIMLQGSSYEYNLGGMLRYRFGNKVSRNYIAGGLQYRVLDALIAQMRLDLGGLTLGVSYDINLSKLTVSSKSIGGPEIMVMFQGCMYHKPRPFLTPVL
jgi:type IX secretion system PorP/SprF family membrane protein